jgi:hypothetical protein
MMSTFFTRRISWFSFPCYTLIVRVIKGAVARIEQQVKWSLESRFQLIG